MSDRVFNAGMCAAVCFGQRIKYGIEDAVLGLVCGFLTWYVASLILGRAQ